MRPNNAPGSLPEGTPPQPGIMPSASVETGFGMLVYVRAFLGGLEAEDYNRKIGAAGCPLTFWAARRLPRQECETLAKVLHEEVC